MEETLKTTGIACGKTTKDLKNKRTDFIENLHQYSEQLKVLSEKHTSLLEETKRIQETIRKLYLPK